MEDIIARLSAPIDPSKVKSRQGDGGGTVFYIERATVIERLNAVLGEAWSFDWQVVHIKDDGDWIVKGSLTINGETRHGIGWGELKVSKKTNKPVFGGPEKAAVSDALKRAASLWGVGAELYEDDYHPQRVAQQNQHWIDDDLTRKKFWVWTKEQGLTKDEVYLALGTDSVHDIPTKAQAVDLITAYVEVIDDGERALSQRELTNELDDFVPRFSTADVASELRLKNAAEARKLIVSVWPEMDQCKNITIDTDMLEHLKEIK